MAKKDPMTVELKVNRASEVSGITRKRLMEHVVKTSFSIQSNAKRNIVDMGAVDTGFMLNSVGSRMASPSTYEVTVGAEYGAYVNFGTRRTPPRPFFTKAFEDERSPFFSGCATIMKSIV